MSTLWYRNQESSEWTKKDMSLQCAGWLSPMVRPRVSDEGFCKGEMDSCGPSRDICYLLETLVCSARSWSWLPPEPRLVCKDARDRTSPCMNSLCLSPACWVCSPSVHLVHGSSSCRPMAPDQVCEAVDQVWVAVDQVWVAGDQVWVAALHGQTRLYHRAVERLWSFHASF